MVGWSAVGFGGGGTASLEVFELDADLTAWSPAGSLLGDRVEVAIAPLAGGHRMLVSGRASGMPPDASAEVHLILD